MALEPSPPLRLLPGTNGSAPCTRKLSGTRPETVPYAGMALEPRTATVDDEENSELNRHETTLPGLRRSYDSPCGGCHGGASAGHPLARIATTETLGWLQLVFATPVVLWEGGPSSCAAGKSVSTTA